MGWTAYVDYGLPFLRLREDCEQNIHGLLDPGGNIIWRKEPPEMLNLPGQGRPCSQGLV